jgi:2-polyprenyl-3-methyl-5-hydroxy-6-metoxy-1,4-benzoquinol methylase
VQSISTGRRADASLCALIARAIDEAWTRPGDLATAAVNLIRTDPTIDACIARASRPSSNRLATDDALLPSELAAFAGNALLITLLENAPVCDFAVERFLTLVRRTMLDAAEDVDAADPSAAIVAFYAAVARQCYLNEYVLACEEGELRRAQALRRAIDEATVSNNPIPALALIVAASYAPLGELESSARLRERSWPDAVQAIIVQQIDEPKREQRYRDDMARMTAIDDPVSLQVRQQYEQNPYPRWIRVPIASRVRRLNEYLRQQFPFAEFEPLARDDAIDVLIAGCGTGQEAIEAARQLTGARVVAIDLSAASLAYAKRKTIEAGIDNVRYAQADILELSSASEMFDVITSVGVLHHLADPMTGWRALLNLLRPGGFMRIGLYSEQARRDIVAARAFIAQNGYASTAADIRRARLDPRRRSFGPILANAAAPRLLHDERMSRSALSRPGASFQRSRYPSHAWRAGPPLHRIPARSPCRSALSRARSARPSVDGLERWNDFEMRFRIRSPGCIGSGCKRPDGLWSAFSLRACSGRRWASEKSSHCFFSQS